MFQTIKKTKEKTTERPLQSTLLLTFSNFMNHRKTIQEPKKILQKNHKKTIFNTKENQL
jgi:hypothetical protein